MRRFLGVAFMILALIVAGLDFTSLGAGEPFQLRAIGSYWTMIDANSLVGLQSLIENNLSPDIWENFVSPVVGWPCAIVLGVIGAVLFIFRHRPSRSDRMMFGSR